MLAHVALELLDHDAALALAQRVVVLVVRVRQVRVDDDDRMLLSHGRTRGRVPSASSAPKRAWALACVRARARTPLTSRCTRMQFCSVWSVKATFQLHSSRMCGILRTYTATPSGLCSRFCLMLRYLRSRCVSSLSTAGRGGAVRCWAGRCWGARTLAAASHRRGPPARR